MSTPRTDAVAKPAQEFKIYYGEDGVKADFARTLERELNNANEILKTLQEYLTYQSVDGKVARRPLRDKLIQSLYCHHLTYER